MWARTTATRGRAAGGREAAGWAPAWHLAIPCGQTRSSQAGERDGRTSGACAMRLCVPEADDMLSFYFWMAQLSLVGASNIAFAMADTSYFAR